ncbi:hypothetical protein [Streptomyces sp. NPDC002785]|uniref:hypothetical protein n=1 Tax=Streptomyces sp. NPDC002785 TaxID=3154543 RepID=UPI003325725F
MALLVVPDPHLAGGIRPTGRARPLVGGPGAACAHAADAFRVPSGSAECRHGPDAYDEEWGDNPAQEFQTALNRGSVDRNLSQDDLRAWRPEHGRGGRRPKTAE